MLRPLFEPEIPIDDQKQPALYQVAIALLFITRQVVECSNAREPVDDCENMVVETRQKVEIYD